MIEPFHCHHRLWPGPPYLPCQKGSIPSMLPVPFGFGWFSSWRLEVTFPTFAFGSLFHHPTKVTNRIARGVKYTTFTQHLGGQIFIFGWHWLASSYRVRNQMLPFGLFGVSNILTKLSRQIRRIISPKVSCTNNARTELNLLRLFRGVGFPLHELYPYIISRWGIFSVLPEMSGDTWGAKLHHESQSRDSCEMVLGAWWIHKIVDESWGVGEKKRDVFYFSKKLFLFQDRIALVGFGFLDWLGLGFGKGSSTTEEKSFMRVKRFLP